MRFDLEKLIKQAEECPFYQLLGMKIEEVREGYARLSMKIEKKHTQLLNTVHGGATASLADSAAAWAAFGSSNLEGVPVTVEMKINFLKPISSGILTAEARQINKGSRILVSDVEVKDNNGNLIAKSLITYYTLKNGHG